jgi:hypothetical protein
MEHLERDRTLVSQIVRQVDGRHAAATQLALDRVAIGQGEQTGSEVRHRDSGRVCPTVVRPRGRGQSRQA